MTETTPVEVTTRYATTVDTLPDAWAFVMDHIDAVGPDPSVDIGPVWFGGLAQVDDDAPWPRRFSVVVSGMVEQTPGGAS